jgi:hypothetical protein
MQDVFHINVDHYTLEKEWRYLYIDYKIALIEPHS